MPSSPWGIAPNDPALRSRAQAKLQALAQQGQPVTELDEQILIADEVTKRANGLIDQAKRALESAGNDPIKQAQAEALLVEANRAAVEMYSVQRAVNEAAGQEVYPISKKVDRLVPMGEPLSKALGTQTLTSPKDLAARVGRALGTADEGGVKNALTLIEGYLRDLKNADPAYRKQVLAHLQPHIQKIGEVLGGDHKVDEDTMKQAMASLSRSCELAGADGARMMADAFARNVPKDDLDIDDKDQIGGALLEAIKGGAGARFAAELTNAFSRYGNKDAAQDAAKLIGEGMGKVRKEFEQQLGFYQNLEAQLFQYVQQNADAHDKDSIRAAIEEFRAKHANEYRLWEEAGRKMASLLNGAGVITNSQALNGSLKHFDRALHESTAALQETELIGRTKAGQEAITNAASEAAIGLPTFLHSLQAALPNDPNVATWVNTVLAHAHNPNGLQKALAEYAFWPKDEGDPNGAIRKKKREGFFKSLLWPDTGVKVLGVDVGKAFAVASIATIPFGGAAALAGAKAASLAGKSKLVGGLKASAKWDVAGLGLGLVPGVLASKGEAHKKDDERRDGARAFMDGLNKPYIIHP